MNKQVSYGIVAAILLPLIGPSTLPAQEPPMRPNAPRIVPLTKAEWTDRQRELLEPLERDRRLYNVFKTFARHPVLFERFRVFGGYILGGSTLPLRDREILILRAGWLCQAPYEWAQHARIAKSIGLSDEEIRRITAGPAAEGWSDFDRALLRAADELHDHTIIGDETWNALGEHYTPQQIIDAILTVGEYHLVSMALNSFGVQLDEGLEERIPTDVDLAARSPSGAIARREEPRLPLMSDSDLSGEQREILRLVRRDDGSVLNLYRTLIHHPAMFSPRYAFGSYLRSESTLAPRDRELLILRIAWLCEAEYEWGHHKQIGREAGLSDAEIKKVSEAPESEGWTEHEAALLRAVDELHGDACISDATWDALDEHLSTEQLMDAVFTVGGYKMLAMLINSLGIPLDEGAAGFFESRN